jgi:UDP-N-acetylglucosamine/UDP-N-acetylgalactosamine diphosphorylase
MSGGQGTRLGFDHPKGMFKIGLQSGMTLFEFFSKRLQALMALARRRIPDGKATAIPWYIMTSEMNNEEIKGFFEENKYFGYDKNYVVFFPQGGLPALDYEGRVVIEGEGKVSLAPGGNGAIYYEMKRHGVIDDLKAKHVKYLHIGGIDNILLKVADPACIGYMIKNNLEVVSKFVNKRSPDEKVGIHVVNNGAVEVCEYSEMPEHYKN